MSELAATSNFGPALATFHGSLYIAWTPPDSEIRVGRIDDRLQLVDDHGLGEYSYRRPALTVFNNRLYVAWTGTDFYATLQVKSSRDGYTFADKAVIGDQHASAGPALAVFDHLLRVAWTGVDPQHSLNVITSQRPRIGGPVGLRFWDKHNLGQSSIGAPALELVAGVEPGNPNYRLFIGWTAADRALHIGSSANGDNFDFRESLIISDTGIGEYSNDGPAVQSLTFLGFDGPFPVMKLWWTGTDARLNSIVSHTGNPPFQGPSFDQKTTFTDTSIAGPSVASFSSTVQVPDQFIAWTGTDDGHHLNVKSVEQLVPA